MKTTYCPYCKNEMEFIEDCKNGKTAWTCPNCDIIVYIVKFEEEE